MRVFVTGGAGYIGSHTCKTLALQGHQVTVYDNLSTGFRHLVKWGTFIHGDIRHTESVRRALRACKAEGIIHFASSIAVGESLLDPVSYYDNNITGSLCLLRAAIEEGVPHVVVSGSAAVYGMPSVLTAQGRIAESCPPLPINPYGRTKLALEWLLQDMQRAHGLNWMALRYFNAAGADPEGETGECHEPETHLIPNVLRAITGNIPTLRVFGDDYDTQDGSCIRDYVHVSDLAQAHVLALAHLMGGGTSCALNLGTGTGISVLGIIHAAQEVTGKTVPYAIEARRQGDPSRLVADASSAQNILGWLPHFPHVTHMVESAWNWHRLNSSQNCL